MKRAFLSLGDSLGDQVGNDALTLILLMLSIGRAPNNASKWQMGFNSAFKGLRV
jgi:hypothetical protein